MNATFPLTRWSQVLAIQKDGEGRAEKALADLCQDYWSPLYAFIRRAGYRPEDAEDLTQGFFTFLIEKALTHHHHHHLHHRNPAHPPPLHNVTQHPLPPLNTR